MSDAPAARYGAVAIGLHWLIAAALVALFWIGWEMTDLDLGPDKLRLYALHKSIGLTVLLAVVVRLLWRATHRPPALPADIARWQHTVSAITHWSLYALLLLIPLSGWLLNGTTGFPISWFGQFGVPNLIGADPSLKDTASFVHETFGKILLALVALHVAGALHHHFVLRDAVLTRMVPALSAREKKQ
ncbi:cytochrome b [Roseiterribacter gracilis]|uniref:Cytochrome b n=1 Tax=Roseiterribacter gracilis TaxID=2812848 RepID=A0A8S8XB68_9PROT|nr:cytochrome b [Rhodospirillales bacterium TMPK1]